MKNNLHDSLKLFFSVALLLFSLSIYSQTTKTTYDFSTSATISGITGSWPWNTTANITIDGVDYKMTCGGNGSFSNVTSGGASGSNCLQKEGCGGDQFTLQRADGTAFQFYGIWVKHQSMNSYSAFYTLPPWYSLSANGEENTVFSFSDNTAKASGDYTYSTQTISAGESGVKVLSVNMSFPAILYYWIDNIIVGPAVTTNIEQSQNKEVMVYPNPTKDFVYIKTEDNNLSNVKLYNLAGTLLKEVQSNMVDVSSLSKGIYLIDVNGIKTKIVKE